MKITKRLLSHVARLVILVLAGSACARKMTSRDSGRGLVREDSGSFSEPISRALSSVGNIFYVDTNGDDSNSCSTAMSMDSPKKSLSDALGCLSAGDTLYVRGGVYDEVIDGGVLNS